MQPDNVAADEAALTSYVVNNAGSDPANVQLERATAGTNETTNWVRVTGVQVPAGSSGRLQGGGLQVTSPGTSTLNALRISSDRPVTVAEIESDDRAQPATSPAAPSCCRCSRWAAAIARSPTRKKPAPTCSNGWAAGPARRA